MTLKQQKKFLLFQGESTVVVGSNPTKRELVPDTARGVG